MTRTDGIKFQTREEWLMAAIDSVRGIFEAAGYPLPEQIRVSVGFGYGARAESKHILAQAWASFATADKIPTVFISPVIEISDDAIGALMHELAHVVDDCEHGHRKEYAAIGRAIGLEGAPTVMLPGVTLTATIITITETLGRYPHAKLDVNGYLEPESDGRPITTRRVHTGPATQTNRHFAAQCHNTECTAKGYLIRTSQKWLDIATPICPVCKKEMHVPL